MFFRNVVAVMLLLAAGPSMALFYRTNTALVVGNSQYPDMVITNGVNDAKLIGQGLKQNGFELTSKYEADRAELMDSLKQFAAEAKHGPRQRQTVVYLSGAGYHCNGEDFFIPNISGAKHPGKKSSSGQQMMELAVPLQQIREQLDGMADNLILIFDAGRIVVGDKCGRPAAPTQLRSHWLNIYSSALGEAAWDGNANSPFAVALAKWLKRTDLTALDVFQNIADDVWQNTDHKQRVHIDSLMPYRIHVGDFQAGGPAQVQQETPATNREVQPAIESKDR